MHEDGHINQGIWNLDSRNIKLFALSCIVMLQVSLLLVFAKMYLRVPLHIPGHSAVYMLPILFLGKQAARWKYAGTGIGFTSGLFASGFGLMGGPLLAFPRLLVMGMMADVVLAKANCTSPLAYVLCGALANTTKVLIGWIIASAVGIPAFFIQAGMTFSIGTHILFGALGGVTAFGIAMAFSRAKGQFAGSA